MLRREIFRTKANVEVKGKQRSKPVKTGRQKSKSSKTRSKNTKARGQHIRQNKWNDHTTREKCIQLAWSSYGKDTRDCVSPAWHHHKTWNAGTALFGSIFLVLNYPTWTSPWWQWQKKTAFRRQKPWADVRFFVGSWLPGLWRWRLDFIHTYTNTAVLLDQVYTYPGKDFTENWCRWNVIAAYILQQGQGLRCLAPNKLVDR